MKTVINKIITWPQKRWNKRGRRLKIGGFCHQILSTMEDTFQKVRLLRVLKFSDFLVSSQAQRVILLESLNIFNTHQLNLVSSFNYLYKSLSFSLIHKLSKFFQIRYKFFVIKSQQLACLISNCQL